MRNPPSTLTALPIATHSLADLESAFNARRVELVHRVRAANIAGRILHMLRSRGAEELPLAALDFAQPTMANPTAPGYRSQPRDGRGRLLSKAWLARAVVHGSRRRVVPEPGGSVAMDPNACLRRAADATKLSERRAALDDLHAWLSCGGFAPHWAMCELGTIAYVKRHGWRPSMPESFRPKAKP
jgi:hypothetical protein